MKDVNRKYHFRGRVVHNDPMTNPESGWVVGFYYQDLCLDRSGKPVMKSFIRSGEMYWEVIPETVGKFLGYDKNGMEAFEGDILQTGIVLLVLEWDDDKYMYVKHLYGIDDVNDVVADGGRNAILYGEMANLKIIGNIFDDKNLIRR